MASVLWRSRVFLFRYWCSLLMAQWSRICRLSLYHTTQVGQPLRNVSPTSSIYTHKQMNWSLCACSWIFQGDINIFHASSFHILLQTTFGLQMQIQHVPVMQLYVTLDQSYRAKTRGMFGIRLNTKDWHQHSRRLLQEGVIVCSRYYNKVCWCIGGLLNNTRHSCNYETHTVLVK